VVSDRCARLSQKTCARGCAHLPDTPPTGSFYLQVDGIGAHPHSFLRDGEEKRVVAVVVSKDAAGGPPTATLSSGLKDLVVMKTAGSAFNGFWRDENTTLPGATLPLSGLKQDIGS
jgi:hypothetical protein